MGLRQVSAANVVMTDSTRVLTVFGVVNVYLKPLFARDFPAIPVSISDGLVFGNSKITLPEVQRGYIFGDGMLLQNIALRLARENNLGGDDKNRLRRLLFGGEIIL